MRKTAKIHIAASCLALLTTLTVSAPAMGQGGPGGASNKRVVSIQPVTLFSDRTSVVPGAGSILVRTKEGVFMTVHSSGLTPGTVVTAWWGFFNNPKNCSTSPCTPPGDLSIPEVEASLVNAGGRIVGPDGTVDFSAFRAVGDATGTELGPGLLEPFKAEIHIALRSHGPARLDDLEVLRQQLTLFTGGCPPGGCVNVQASRHQP